MTDNVARSVSVPQIPPVGPIAVQPATPAPAARNDNHDASRFRLTIEAVGEAAVLDDELEHPTRSPAAVTPTATAAIGDYLDCTIKGKTISSMQNVTKGLAGDIFHNDVRRLSPTL